MTAHQTQSLPLLVWQTIEIRRLKTGTVGFESISGILSQEGFSHLTSCRIVRTQKQNF
jgi:hypothetical protein